MEKIKDLEIKPEFKELIVKGEMARITMAKVWNHFINDSILKSKDFDNMIKEVNKDFNNYFDKIERELNEK